MAIVGQQVVSTSAGAGLDAATVALLERALGGERDMRTWRARFTAMLSHPAVSALPALGGATASSLGAIALAGQYATRFPLVSGDADWLRQRSMGVLARRLAPLLAGGGRVSLDLTRLSRGETPPHTRREQMHEVAEGLAGVLPTALRRYGVTPSGLLLAAECDHPGLGALLRLHSAAGLGRPGIVLRLTEPLLTSLQGAPRGSGRDEAVGRWQGLTALAQREPGIHLVLPRTTRPACALASGEPADTVLPASLFEAGASSAWLALELRLDRLEARGPAPALAELRLLVRAILRFADNLVDQVDWPCPELAQDALVNRRVALHVTGLGSAADRWSVDPADFRAVETLTRWVSLVRRLLVRESNALARERGPFPGLELRELGRSLARSLGEAEARRVLRRAGLRHRHLLVLSPWDVFPLGSPRHALPRYLELLPALRHADTVAMHGDGMARAVPPTLFRRLLHQAWVIARNRS